MQVYDSHLHYWDPRTTPRLASPFVFALGRWPALMRRTMQLVMPPPAAAFVGKPDYLLRAYLPAEHDARFADAGLQLTGVTHVEAGWPDPRPLGPAAESRWLRRIDSSPDAIVGAAKLDHGGLERLLDAHARAHPGVVGVRDKLAHSSESSVLSWSRPRRMQSAAFHRGLETLARRELSFDTFVYAEQLPELCKVAAAHGDVPMAVTSAPVAIGGPYRRVGRTAAERADVKARYLDDVARLAECKNVVLKLSGVGMPMLGFGFHERAQPPSPEELDERIGPLYESGLQLFGADRCMFGSNFPMDLVSLELGAIVGALSRAVDRVAPGAGPAVFESNARRFYGVS